MTEFNVDVMVGYACKNDQLYMILPTLNTSAIHVPNWREIADDSSLEYWDLEDLLSKSYSRHFLQTVVISLMNSRPHFFLGNRPIDPKNIGLIHEGVLQMGDIEYTMELFCFRHESDSNEYDPMPVRLKDLEINSHKLISYNQVTTPLQ